MPRNRRSQGNKYKKINKKNIAKQIDHFGAVDSAADVVLNGISNSDSSVSAEATQMSDGEILLSQITISKDVKCLEAPDSVYESFSDTSTASDNASTDGFISDNEYTASDEASVGSRDSTDNKVFSGRLLEDPVLGDCFTGNTLHILGMLYRRISCKGLKVQLMSNYFFKLRHRTLLIMLHMRKRIILFRM